MQLTPPHLRKGDLIALIAPASTPVASERIDGGVKYLERLGYSVVAGKHALDVNGYLADAMPGPFTARGGSGPHGPQGAAEREEQTRGGEVCRVDGLHDAESCTSFLSVLRCSQIGKTGAWE